MNETHLLKQDPRRIARILAVQYLFTHFQAELHAMTVSIFEPQALAQLIESPKYKKSLYEKLIEGVIDSATYIDAKITELAPAWPIEQMNPVDLVILRCAIWEAFVGEVTPPKVVINEAVEISKLLSSEQSARFINGVLGKLVTPIIKHVSSSP